VKYDQITYMDILRQGLKVMDLTAVKAYARTTTCP